MKIITIGSFKGGTGKTTLAAMLGTSFTLRGVKTRVLELDTTTKTLARFEACREFADIERASVEEARVSGGAPDLKDWQSNFNMLARTAESEGYEALIIDTGSVWKPEVIAAHLAADLVLTTVTESPIDLYQFMPGEGPTMQAVRPYSELISLVRRNAEKMNKPNFDWMLCINRRSHLRTRIGDSVYNRLSDFTRDADIGLIDGLVDRVGYRNMMETGITPLDDIAGTPVQKSLLAARTEINRLTGKLLAKLQIGAYARHFEQA
jgi:chromosome partitioning protein